MTLLQILLGITSLFFLFLIARSMLSNKLKENFCVICAAISISWLVLLVLLKLSYFNDKTIIALLMGQSILGVFYLAEKKAKEQYKIFRLPFLLTLTLLAYYILGPQQDIINSVIFISILWLAFVLVFVYRNNNKINLLTKKLIECCRNW